MQVIRWNGHPVPTRGWYADVHGHRLFLREGEIAPICPHGGPARVAWRLVSPVPGR